MTIIAIATPDDPEPSRRRQGKKNKAKLRDGVMKRGRTWSYVIRVKDPETGVSKPKWVGGFDNEEAAKAARDEARIKARRGEYIDRSSITVGGYLDQWVEAHAVEIKPKTLLSYRYLVELVKPHIGKIRLQAVRPARITRMYRDLVTEGGTTGKGLSPRTVAHVHAVLRKAFGDAVNTDQLIAVNPVARAKRPRVENDEPGNVWTVDELRRFLGFAERHRLYAFFHLAAYSGARRGELLNLRWADVDLDGSAINITGSATFISGERIEGTTKNGRSRIVSLDDDDTIRVLREHLSRQAADKERAGDEWKAQGVRGDYVFMTSWGRPISPDTASSLMADLIKGCNRDLGPSEAALPHARLHDLRHIHATTLLLAGVPVHVVAARLGHTDPAVTLR
ncbi:MAG: tyrosine-type recombinase/integrase, partial [Stackebrandtia sp.]